MTYLEGSEDNDYNSEVAISDPEENSEEIALPTAENENGETINQLSSQIDRK